MARSSHDAFSVARTVALDKSLGQFSEIIGKFALINATPDLEKGVGAVGSMRLHAFLMRMRYAIAK